LLVGRAGCEGKKIEKACLTLKNLGVHDGEFTFNAEVGEINLGSRPQIGKKKEIEFVHGDLCKGLEPLKENGTK